MDTNKVKETVETIKSEAVDTAKKLSKAAEPAVEAAKNTIKNVGEIAEPAVKKAKSTAKKTAKAAGTAAKNTAKAAESAAKTAGKKIAAAIVPEVYVEYVGKQFDCVQLVERCKADFKSKHKSSPIRSCKLYIKPEDQTVYYVINGKEDKIEL